MCLKGHLRTGLWVLILALPVFAQAQGIPMVNVSGGAKGTQYSLTLQVLALMTSLTLLPSFLLMMTSFVRIIIVLSILRQALGTGQTPPNTVLVGLALFLSLFIMSPVLQDVYANAITPYMSNNLSFEKALSAAEGPLRGFMLKQTREDDISLFMQMANNKEVATAAEVPGAEPRREHLAVPARQLALQPGLHLLRKPARPLLPRLEPARETALAHYIHRAPRMDPWVLINGIWY